MEIDTQNVTPGWLFGSCLFCDVPCAQMIGFRQQHPSLARYTIPGCTASGKVCDFLPLIMLVKRLCNRLRDMRRRVNIRAILIKRFGHKPRTEARRSRVPRCQQVSLIELRLQACYFVRIFLYLLIGRRGTDLRAVLQCLDGLRTCQCGAPELLSVSLDF